jgi:hypothetical protein
MSFERVQITNFERWGKLIKTWATGRDYLQDGHAYPVPRTLNELKEQCSRAQVGARIPECITGLQVVQMNTETLVIRLPPKEGLEDSEARLAAGSAYMIPAFYKRVFNGQDPKIPEGDKLKFHAERIGDYTIGNCI